MNEPLSIRIIEKDSNRRGDLFGRLMADLFVALGYNQPRLNIHKPGRELDLVADHRLESRRAVGECKATAEPIGGDEVNKFVGALDAEYEDNCPIIGYFISLSGFKETAIEQEKKRRRTKIITLAAPQIIEELVRGRVLISRERAAELAGRCCAGSDHLVLDPHAELLAHERGWIWVVYYTQGTARTHFALIHADGTLLARTLVAGIVTADHECDGPLHSLRCLNPVPVGAEDDARVAETLAAYSRYLAEECGFIYLDGLPADSDLSRRLRLENLFVPLHLDIIQQKENQPIDAVLEKHSRHELPAPPGGEQKERLPVGAVLEKHNRLAILAPPGGGKSTLIKRLAVAYSDPARLAQIGDKLPQRKWFPLFFRCRELRDLARGSFADLLDALAQQEPVRQYSTTLRTYVDRMLFEGRALLLVDGLDEISDSGDRAAFVCTLRTALRAYPDTAFIVTSREAGFRHVAGHLAPVCTQATLSPFNPSDIRRLTVDWHREVAGDSEKVRVDAEQLAKIIVANDRIKRLAINPLLLTTLLLVKRWVGSLPTRRAILYDKAVEVLLNTWNREGHDPMPEEEALPQLCYVASAMMFEGKQEISRPSLSTLLQKSREALLAELGYVKDTVEEFIRRIEDRSSLLMMTGHKVENGRLVEFFEFRHLTFQEFLAARAMVEGWHPDRQENDTLVSVLEPHLEKRDWREIIPLAAVLGGKANEALLRRLTEKHLIIPIGHCLADEAPAKPETIRAALRELVLSGETLMDSDFTPALARGRYGSDFRDEAAKAFLTPTHNLRNAGQALGLAVWWQTIGVEEPEDYVRSAMQFFKMINNTERLSRCEGALGCEQLCYRVMPIKSLRLRGGFQACDEPLAQAVPTLVQMAFSDNSSEQYAGIWALVWLSERELWQSPSDLDFIGRMYTLMHSSPNIHLREMAAWAVANYKPPYPTEYDKKTIAALSEWTGLKLKRSFGFHTKDGAPSFGTGSRGERAFTQITEPK
jgi:hypothetical protein